MGPGYLMCLCSDLRIIVHTIIPSVASETITSSLLSFSLILVVIFFLTGAFTFRQFFLPFLTTLVSFWFYSLDINIYQRINSLLHIHHIIFLMIWLHLCTWCISTNKSLYSYSSYLIWCRCMPYGSIQHLGNCRYNRCTHKPCSDDLSDESTTSLLSWLNSTRTGTACDESCHSVEGLHRTAWTFPFRCPRPGPGPGSCSFARTITLVDWVIARSRCRGSFLSQFNLVHPERQV
jgi:hypothetical protein